MDIDICFESAFLGNLVEKKKMSARLSVEERVQFVWLYAKFESIVKVQRKWRNLHLRATVQSNNSKSG